MVQPNTPSGLPQGNAAFSRVQLLSVKELAKIIGLSIPTIWRHHEEGIIPRGVKIGGSVRWRLRTGDPETGILDWIVAGCPQCPSSGEPSSEAGGPNCG